MTRGPYGPQASSTDFAKVDEVLASSGLALPPGGRIYFNAGLNQWMGRLVSGSICSGWRCASVNKYKSDEVDVVGDVVAVDRKS